MKVVKDNNVRTLTSFEFKNKMSHSEIINFIKKKDSKFNLESSLQTKDKVVIITKGQTNSAILLGIIKNIDNIKNIKTKHLYSTSFFFDIKIINERLIKKLEGESDDCTTKGFLIYHLNKFEFFETLSNFIYFKVDKCLRLYFKDIIDYEYASLEFAKYTKKYEKDFVYPKNVNTKKDNIDVFDNNYIERVSEGDEIKKFMGKTSLNSNKNRIRKREVIKTNHTSNPLKRKRIIENKKNKKVKTCLSESQIKVVSGLLDGLEYKPKVKKRVVIKIRKKKSNPKKKVNSSPKKNHTSEYEKLNKKFMNKITNPRIKDVLFSIETKNNDSLFFDKLENILSSLEVD